MPTTAAQLIQTAMEDADVEKSNATSPAERLRIVNEALSATYDTIVAVWQSYFASSAPFTLTGNSISLAEITSGIPPVPAYPVATPQVGPRTPTLPDHTFSSTVSMATTDPQFFAVGGTTSFPTSRGYVPPAGRVLQLQISTGSAGTGTTFTIAKNGVLTGATIYVPYGAGGTLSVTEGDFGGPVHFNGSDVMDLVAVAETFGESAYDFESQVIFQLDQPAGDFYKELGLTRTDPCPQPIPQLSGYADRATCDGPRFLIQGGYLSIWPQTNDTQHAGAYRLDYVPNCPVLGTGDVLPPELERWKELITVNAAIKFLLKRNRSTADMERRQAKLEAGIKIAATNRVTDVRKLRADHSHDGARFGGVSRWRR